VTSVALAHLIFFLHRVVAHLTLPSSYHPRV
jgi:hypothetical protein